MSLSVVVLAKNEEANIGSCLKSVADWADEILLVDDESSDQTVAIAQEFTDKIFRHRMTNEGQHRNWAYAQARNEWVLSLDADEFVTDALKEEIMAVLSAGTRFQAFAIPIKTYIGSYWVRYAGWYPASKIRLFQKQRFKYEEVEVHPCAQLDGIPSTLTGDIIHKGYPDFEHFLLSVNRQSTLEAQKWIRTGKNVTTGKVVRRTVDRFLRSFIRKRGIKDGFVGFMVAYFASLYQIMSYAKYREMKGKLKSDSSQSTSEKNYESRIS